MVAPPRLLFSPQYPRDSGDKTAEDILSSKGSKRMELTEEHWSLLRTASRQEERVRAPAPYGNYVVLAEKTARAEELVELGYLGPGALFDADKRVVYRLTFLGADVVTDYLLPQRIAAIAERDARAPEHLTGTAVLDRRELVAITKRQQARLLRAEQEVAKLRQKLAESEETRRQENAALTAVLEPPAPSPEQIAREEGWSEDLLALLQKVDLRSALAAVFIGKQDIPELRQRMAERAISLLQKVAQEYRLRLPAMSVTVHPGGRIVISPIRQPGDFEPPPGQEVEL